MSAKVIRDNNRIPDLVKILEELHKTEIHIGIFGKDDSHLLMIANVHEYGCTIKPKRAKRLAIPLNKMARGRSPRQFSDLYPLTTRDGALYLVRDKGQNQIEFMYWLATEVHIPERSFIRGGFDANSNRFSNRATALLKKVISGAMTMDAFFTMMGEYIVSELQKYMTNLKTPPKSRTTISASGGKTNPLIDTGRLRDAITYKVVKN